MRKYRGLFDSESAKKIGIDRIIAEQIDQIKYSEFIYDDATTEQYKDLIYMHLINNDAMYEGRSRFIRFKESISRLLSPIL
ncbi:hypothetical protein [Alkalihalobacillus sp. BA299]|uniref:hypothetical protein n=1 Tax=Alkalihalobacillus sp. BA299 TaxID=2815938 RepID=UPI001ADB47BE|nr:hypothetical protein [Alkalihalobacillus sp. BA299]